jgi:hypothetical protein
MLDTKKIKQLQDAWNNNEIGISMRIVENVSELLRLAAMAMAMIEFVKEYDPECLMVKLKTRHPLHPSPLCQCAECQGKFEQMGKPSIIDAAVDGPGHVIK